MMRLRVVGDVQVDSLMFVGMGARVIDMFVWLLDIIDSISWRNSLSASLNVKIMSTMAPKATIPSN